MNDLRLARILSVAGHPLVLIPLTLALTTRSWQVTALLAATTTLPLAVVLLRQVRRGTLSDLDVSRREERSGLYYVAIPLLAVGAIAVYLTGGSPVLLRGLAATAGMFTVGLLANRFLKISMHMMLAVYCAVLVVRTHPWSAVAILPFVLAVAWSRWRLQRHTVAELAVGGALGAAAGFYVIA